MTPKNSAFWLLKKYSSMTSWGLLADAYRRFSAAFEYAVTHEAHQDDWDEIALRNILDGVIAFDKGMVRLKRGERSTFFSNATTNLAATQRAYEYITRIMDPEEFVFDWMSNKGEVLAAATLLMNMEPNRRHFFVLRDPVTAKYAPFSSYQELLATFSDPDLPESLPPPPPPSSVIVRTSSPVPIDGIWEPEWEVGPGIVGRLHGEHAYIEKGCMNYLLAGSSGPLLTGPKGDMHVTWRLLWEDNRYKDGTIPEEEKEYYPANPNVPSPDAPKCLANNPCPIAGYWFSTAEQHSRRYFNKGDIMPGFPHAPTATVWYWDRDQSTPSTQ